MSLIPHPIHLGQPVIVDLQPISFHQTQRSSLSQRLHQAFKSCEHAWGYLGKSLLATRHFMNATARSARLFAIGSRGVQRIQKAVTGLKLFAIVSVPFNIAAIPSQMAKVGKHIHVKDGEGVVLASLSFSLIATDIFDSLTTFVNAVLQTFSKPIPSWLSSLGMPIAVSMVTMGSIARRIRLIRLKEFHSDLECKLIQKMSSGQLSAEELQQVLKAYLESNIGLGEVGQQAAFHVERLEAIAERQSNTRVLALLKELKTYIQPDRALKEEDVSRITSVIQEMEKALRTEMGSQWAYLFTNLLNAMALTLFHISILPPLPFILLGVSTCLRLLLHSELISVEIPKMREART